MPSLGQSRRDQASHGGSVVAVAVVLVALLGAFGLLIASNQTAVEDALLGRFETRASLTAAFVSDYVQEVADRELAQASSLLSAAEVDQAVFEQVVHSMSFNAAVLLDEDGLLVHVWPRRPELIGTDMTVEYDHLRAAVEGHVGVSEMVESAAEREPAVAVAVPFETAWGRRVFSGAFSPATSPLGAYLGSVVTASGGAGYLTDHSGDLLASGQGPAAPPEAALAAPNGVTQIDVGPTPTVVAASAVEGTPWRVMLAVPSATLLAPVEQGRWGPWALLGALALSGVLVVVLFMSLRRARAEAFHTARTDVLTGLPNRRAVSEMLSRSVAHATRHGEPLAVLMIDLDNFKGVNDAHGHDVGDLVLRHAADAMLRAGRTEDIAGRWGGEEFLVVLQTTGAEAARVAADRLRCSVAADAVRAGRIEVRVTVSIGVAVLGADGDIEALVRASDAALYEAKAAGRDTVVVALASGGGPRGPIPPTMAAATTD